MPTHTAGADLPSNDDVTSNLRRAATRVVDGLQCNLFLDWEVKSSEDGRNAAITRLVELYERVDHELKWG